MGPAEPASGNRSLQRGVAIIRAFKPGLALLGNAELAERTGLPKSTVSRLTQTLVESGMLEHDKASRAYRLAPSVLSLAHAMRLGSPTLSAIAPLMRAKAEERRVNVGLAAADGDAMVYLESFRYSHRVRFRTVVSGARVPIELTSLGRAYLWSLPPTARTAALATIAERRAREWKRLEREIDQSFDELERFGICAVRWQPRALAVATPISDGRQAPHALNLSIASDEPLGAGLRRLGPWLLDLKTRCFEELALRAADAPPGTKRPSSG